MVIGGNNVDPQVLFAGGWDHVIIGGGSAGCVLARRLSDDPHRRVLLLEAGDRAIHPAIWEPTAWPGLAGGPNDWDYVSTPQSGMNGRAVAQPRGKGLGGSTLINALGFQRGPMEAYDAWASASGDEGWGGRGLLPYFRRLESTTCGEDAFRGREGPVRILDVATVADRNPLSVAIAEAGISAGHPWNPDWNGAACAGTVGTQLTMRDGRRETAGSAYLDPVSHRANLCVATGIMVRHLMFSSRRCTGVAVSTSEGNEIIAGFEEAILSAGAIDSPRLLMLSGVGDADALQSFGVHVVADSPEVGRNLQDHPLVPGILLRARRPVPPSHYNHCETQVIARSSFAKTVPDIQIMGLTVPFLSPQLGVAPEGCFSFVPALMAPQSRGSLELVGTGEKRFIRIDPNYLAESQDVEALVDAVEMSRDILAQPALQDWVAEEIHPGPDLCTRAAIGKHVRRTASPFFHPVSTCRMGQDPRSVTDPQCRVRGLEGLRIIDASIMPSIPQAMTNAAVLALAERAADIIRGTAI